MSSDEEDYMSDKVLQACTQKTGDVRPGLIRDHSKRREHNIAVKKARLDNENKKKITPAIRLQEGLSTSISSSSKGFAMLQKMGYKEGTGLGKTQKGIVEPIGIQLKSDRGGLGRDAAIKEIQQYRAEARLKKLNKGQDLDNVTPEEYRKRMVQKSEARQIEADLSKSQKACFRLDQDHKVDYPIMDWFWPERKPVKKLDEESEEEAKEEDTKNEKYEPSEKLDMLTKYLRTCYFYCTWCGIKYENPQDLFSNCPGDKKDDH